MKHFTSICLLLVAMHQLPAQQKLTAQAIVQQLNLEEKARLVVGMGMRFPGAGGPAVGVTQEKVPGAAGTTAAFPKFGVPTVVVADGPAGLRIQPVRDNDSSRTYYATAFPIATMLASTWNTGLINEVGRAMGSEVKEYGVDILLAPALNIHRNPLGGRNFEYYSEDPLVSGKVTAAMVNGIQWNGVGTSIKHFAGNNQETNRNLVNTIVSERALREIYLKGFEIAVKESKPWTVMSSYNKINGVYTSQSYDLLTTILRKEWGYKGFVMTDWFGGDNPVEQMKAGNDLLMPGTPDQLKQILDAVKAGRLKESVLNENAARIITIALASPSGKKYAFSNLPDLKAHAAIARAAAAEGTVLLKNEGGVLPLKTKSIAAFGNTSYEFISGGTGSGDVNEAYTVSLIQGLEAAGYQPDQELETAYRNHIATAKAKRPPVKFFFELPAPLPEYEVADEVINQKAMVNDIAMVTIGRNSGEFQDRKAEGDFYLGETEKNLLRKVSAAFHAKGKKMVVILNTGGVVETASWSPWADAIVLAWQGGQEAGNAVADILSGKITPSAKLTTTFPVKYEDVPSAKNFPGKNLSDVEVKSSMGFALGYISEVRYEEGVYTGYRYYNSFNVPVAYPFGFGLSYTHFSYGNLKLSSARFNNTLQVSVTVTNTGAVAGKEAVQLYLAAPAQQMHKPVMELKGFAKTRLLQPGEKEILQFTITKDALASFDAAQSAWVAEAGNYTVHIGASSQDLRLKASFELPWKRVTEKVNRVLLPQAPVDKLQR